jgi:O-antigen ligase
LFCALALAAKGSVDASAALWFSALAAAFLGASVVGNEPKRLSLLGAALLGYAAWLVATNLCCNPYTAAAPYDAAFLVAGFLAGRRGGEEAAPLLLRIALAFAVAVAAWSVWQRATGEAARGHALFETPATLASTLNLVLVPGVVMLAAGCRSRLLFLSLAVVAAALIGTASRGGWLACAGAGAVSIALFARAGIRLERRSMLAVLAVFVVGYAVSLAAPLRWEAVIGTAPASATARLALYEAALQALGESSWLTGYGYLGFRHVLEAARPGIPEYRDAITYFVHDDYLQVLLELGIPGLALLLLVAVLPVVQVWRALPRLPAPSRATFIALAGATTSMAVHALIDFPFYIAVCLLLYGACTGLIASMAGDGGMPRFDVPRYPALMRAAKAGVAAAAAWLLVMPLAAEAAADYARRQFENGRSDKAAYWFEAARRLDARDWRYHWYAGQFWYAQAQANRNAAAARLADVALASAFAADPHEVQPLVWRISAHLRLRELLPAPADPATLRAWGDLAASLAPLDRGVQAHREMIRRFEASGR